MGTTGGSRDSRVYRFELSLEQIRMGNNDDWFRERPEGQRLRAWVCLHAYVFLLSNGRQTSSLLAPELRLSLSLSLALSLSLLSPRSGLWLGPPSMPRRGSSLSLPLFPFLYLPLSLSLSEAWPLAGLSIYASSWVVSLSPFNGKLLFFHGRGYLNLPRCTLQKLNSQWRCTHEKTASDPRPSVTFASRISTTS